MVTCILAPRHFSTHEPVFFFIPDDVLLSCEELVSVRRNTGMRSAEAPEEETPLSAVAG